ncbi:MAG: SPOR domain-containing protein [Candidatus Kapaibacterium sp.]
MDPKDPVWDDDDSSPVSDGFHPQSTPLEETVPAASEEPEAPEHAPVAPSPVPPPPSERVRVEPVDSLRRPAAGGGRSAASARDRRDRSSASMVVIALMLFLISVISIGVYFFSRQARDESGADGSEKVEYLDQNDQDGTSSANAGSQAPASQEPTGNEADTTPPPPPPPGAPAAAPLPPKTTQVAAPTTSPSRDIAAAAVPRSERQPEPVPEPAVKPAPKAPVEPVKPAPSKDIAKPQQPMQNSAPAPRTNPQLKTTKGNNSGDAQWVIQVHSSPSVDDADEWLQQLQSRNVGDGRIEPVTQQGRVWYRVRFGRYATREEAEQAALQLGYRNAWIDRVR